MYIIKYTGDGGTTEFNFDFPFFKAADINVSVNSQILQSGQFSVVLTEAVQADGMYYGGRVVLNSAPALGAEISIWRKIDLSRVIDYQPTLPIQTETLNADFNFMLEYMRDLYELDGDVANIENSVQFIDSIQSQIESLGGIGELARKDELPDFTEYAKKSEIPDVSNFAEKQDIPDVSNFATKDEIPDISNLASKDEIPDISNLATKAEIPDLTEYAKKTEIPDTGNFALKNHTHDMSAYATKTELTAQITELEDKIDSSSSGSSFPIEFTDDDDPDIIVKYQSPTSGNGYTWYRKYKSGWVEQGGPIALLVLFPIKMKDTNYGVAVGNSSSKYEQIRWQNKSTTGIGFINSNGTAASGDFVVYGMAA